MGIEVGLFPVSGAEAKEVMEALAARVVRILGSVMPFPEIAGGIISPGEHFTKRIFIRTHHLFPRSNAINTCTEVVPPREK